VPGHLFVVQGDVRKIASAAWLLPCDRGGTISPVWLEDDPGLRARVDAFRPHAVAAFDEGRRVARLPGDERPHVWMVDTGGYEGMAENWYAEGLAEFVAAVADEAAETRPKLAVAPFVGAGLGGKALDKGTLLPRLLGTLAEEAQRLDLDVAFVTRDRRAFGAARRSAAATRIATGRLWPTGSCTSPTASPNEPHPVRSWHSWAQGRAATPDSRTGRSFSDALPPRRPSMDRSRMTWPSSTLSTRQ
jgi:hypothetical protein